MEQKPPVNDVHPQGTKFEITVKATRQKQLILIAITYHGTPIDTSGPSAYQSVNPSSPPETVFTSDSLAIPPAQYNTPIPTAYGTLILRLKFFN